jgi:glycosyltransferase 2 family protein
MKKIRYIFTAILIIIAFFVVFPEFKNSIPEIPGLFRNANKFLILFMVLFQLLTYFSDGLSTKILLKIAGYDIRLKNTLRISIVDTLANLMLPLIGGSVIKYYFYKKLKVPSSAILFLITSWTLLFYFTALIFFVFSIFFIPKSESFIPINIILLIIAALIIFFYILLKKGNKLVSKLLNFFIITANKLFAKLFKRKPISKERLQDFNLKFGQTFSELKSSKKDFLFALCASFLYYLFDILTVYFAFLVFGFHPNIFLVIFGFTISSVLSYLTSIPYIPGVVESSLVMVFVKLGFPANVSILASFLFRLFSYWFPMPIGLISYLDFRRDSGKSGQKEI